MRNEMDSQLSLNCIEEKIINNVSGMISAFCEGTSDDENSTNSRKLMAQLLAKGFDLIKINGHLEDSKGFERKEVLYVPSENSRTRGELHDFLIVLGEEHNQDHVICSRNGELFLVGTCHAQGSFPTYHDWVDIKRSQPEGPQNILYMIKNHSFIFENASVVREPDTRMGKWAMHLTARSRNEE